MKTLFIHLFISCLFIFSGCIPANFANKKSLGDTSVDGEGGTTAGATSPFAGDDSKNLFWYTSAQVEGLLELKYSDSSIIYLRGNLVHDFLSTSTQTREQAYCLAVSFYSGDPATSQILRLRATAHSVNAYTFDTTSTEYLFKINLNDTAAQQQNCNGTVALVNLKGQTVSNISTAAYTLTDVCPTCSTSKTSTNVSLYTATANNDTTVDSISTTSRISPNLLDLSSLSMRINFNPYSTTTDSGQCTNSGCVAQGFDCCVNGQCITDKTLTESAQAAFNCLQYAETNPGDYSLCLPTKDLSSYNNTQIVYGQAYSDAKTNPLSYKIYTDYYNTCSSNSNTDTTSTQDTNTDPSEEAKALLEELKLKYYCLEEGKKEVPQYADELVCLPGYDQASHDAIVLEVWKQCGCNANPFPTDVEDYRCPHYGLKATTDTQGNITNIVCELPDTTTGDVTFKDLLSVNVSSRSVPHRFFNSVGTGYDSLEAASAANSSTTQEGGTFAYMDNSAKTGPLQEDFDMNAILGPMTVDLSNAKPAKVIDLEFGQNYIITALSGYFTPCPQCVEDSWFASFKSHPSSQNGLGTQFSGAITNRSLYSNNLGLGNYEDTIFGRACWVPPTMIPFTHKANSNVQQQRLNRLASQTALYVNGYQRDWYGFNQGALIGSFDGVTWFAIGKGRRVTATSNKLFLAINAPFADLTESSSIVASVIQDQGGNVVADYDFEPSLSLSDARQNQGASCQYNHQCNVDADCVARLGWEYVCSDVSEMSTTWPKFDTNADELANEEYLSAGVAQILQGNFPSGSYKRCVYRGAGSVCKKDYSTLNSGRPNLQEQFRCAPNFYCADLGASDFNSTLVRTPNQLNVFYFGQEADILGRPYNYLGGSERLDSNIISNLQYNFKQISSDYSDYGICRPGKNIGSSAHLDQHADLDTGKRTDYINQISSCDSTATSDTRVQSCPQFDTDPDSSTYGDYVLTSSATAKHQQNMCGGESAYIDGTDNVSSFKDIEAGIISSIYSLITPSVTADACFRRAGSFCHTDLDCSPNRLHAEQAVVLGSDQFGGTTAELQFWQENLVCGQADTKPLIQAEDFLNYDLTANRCCREVGNDITMYTQSNSLTVNPDLGSENLSLEVGTFPYADPTANNRYSRYVTAQAYDYALGTPPTSAFDQLPIVNAAQTPKLYQWKTFNDTGSDTCCGGGWVRKFADGTHDWTVRNRLNLNVSNFQCLNYSNSIVQSRPSEVASTNYNNDYDQLCLDHEDGGCIQSPIMEVSGFEVTKPSEPTVDFPTMVTTPQSQPTSCQAPAQTQSTLVPYMPTGVTLPNPTDPDCNIPRNYFHTAADYGISFNLPIYIGHLANIVSAKIEYVKSGETNEIRTLKTISGSTTTIDECPTSNFDPLTLTDPDSWCYEVRNGNNVIIHVRAVNVAVGGDSSALYPFGTTVIWDYAGLRINFGAMGTDGYLYGAGATPAGTITFRGSGATDSTRNGMNAGNALYYLTKLARLELLGVPQIFYEPLYCNSDRSSMVDGIFNSNSTRASFEGLSTSFSYDNTHSGLTLEGIYDSTNTGADIANSSSTVVYQDQVALTPVFSGSEFTCCAKLGQEVDSASQCCTNYAADPDGQGTICMIPSGTDLNVYFNKFISSEGVGSELPSGGLSDDDFIAQTGEPKLRQSTYNKILAIGKEYCQNKAVRKGGAFGNFFGEPNSGYIIGTSQEDAQRFGIVDSTQDEDPTYETGFSYFMQGFKWDHHFYCE